MAAQPHVLSGPNPSQRDWRISHLTSRGVLRLTMPPVSLSWARLPWLDPVEGYPFGKTRHAVLAQEKAMMASGKWVDTSYAACCFAGARCKMQRLRHNVSEISDWPPLQCHHEHDPNEWTPYEQDGKRIYPSTSEAEYTAPLAFSLAVAASWSAVRTGRAQLHVPRAPAVGCVGRRVHWLRWRLGYAQLHVQSVPEFQSGSEFLT